MANYRTALVTGASSGIGTELARELARRGTDLVLVARRTDRLHDLAEELKGVEVEVLGADLSTEAGIEAVEGRLAERPVELLVNNAGVGTSGVFQESSAGDEANVVRVNVVALHRLTHAAIHPMAAAGHGGVLNVSSMAGDQPLRGFASYAASKAFVTMFTESLAADLRGTGVHVTVVKPGYVYTEMTDGSQPDHASLMGRIWLEADAVAKSAVDAVERNQLVCVPGLTWRAASGLITSLPRPLVRLISSRVPAIGN